MWTCPKCERELRNPHQWHYCEKVNIDDLFAGKSPELEPAFDQLLAHIVEWEDVAISATKNCIVFVHHQTFLVIRPLKKQLDLKFYSKEAQNEFPIVKSVLSSGKFENHIRLSTVDEISTEVLNFIKQSYLLL